MAIYFDSEATDSLQHYEEGTFTLTLTNTSGGGETSGGTGNYTRIGRWVNCWGQITFGNAAFFSSVFFFSENAFPLNGNKISVKINSDDRSNHYKLIHFY